MVFLHRKEEGKRLVKKEKKTKKEKEEKYKTEKTNIKEKRYR